VTFPLLALTLTEAQCHVIQSPALMALLPKLHLNRHTARSIIHGPRQLGGMSIPHLYTKQGLDGLKFLVGHLRAQDKTCKLILISHSCLQLLLGVSTNFLNLDYNRYHSWYTSTWLTSIWKFNTRLGIKLTIVGAWLPPPKTGNNVNLMDHFVAANLPAYQLQSINRYRVYLQVIALSDVCSADGRQIIPTIFLGHRLLDRRSTLVWPDQANPPQSDWKIWASALQTLCYGTNLQRPIAMNAIHNHQSWFWYMDRANFLFKQQDNMWEKYSPTIYSTCQTRQSHYRYYNTSQGQSSTTVPPSPLLKTRIEVIRPGLFKAVPNPSP